MGVAEIFPGEVTSKFCLSFRFLTTQCKRTFTKRFTLSTPLISAGSTSILNLLSEMFFTLRLPEMLFLFINSLYPFFEHLLQVSHNLRIINGQNNMSGEKTRKLDTVAKLFHAVSSTICTLTRISDNLLKLEHHAGLKIGADELRKLATANIALHLVLTRESELNR